MESHTRLTQNGERAPRDQHGPALCSISARISWRQATRGEITIVRYADDAILAFERQHEAERYHGEPREHPREYGWSGMKTRHG